MCALGGIESDVCAYIERAVQASHGADSQIVCTLDATEDGPFRNLAMMHQTILSMKLVEADMFHRPALNENLALCLI